MIEKTKKTLKKTKEKLGKINPFKEKHKKEKPDLFTKQWFKQEAFDWTISILTAVAIYFVILPAILHTNSPLIVVSSCSEEPHLNIGNVLVLQGTKVKDVNAPTVEINSSLEYQFNYNESLIINGEELRKNTSNDIVVYTAKPSGYQIIHRALAKLKTPDEEYLLTWGDANPVPDQVTANKIKGKRRLCLSSNPNACISTPIKNSMLTGKKIGWRIPLAGHVKLFFCDITPFCEGHSNKATNYQYKLTC